MRCRRGANGCLLEPPWWTCPATGVQYFDALNQRYAMAVHYMCLYAPAGFRITYSNWGDELVGDFLECGLALAYRDPMNPNNLAFRDHLEKVVFAVIDLEVRLKCPLGFSPRMWAHFVDEVRVQLNNAVEEDPEPEGEPDR